MVRAKICSFYYATIMFMDAIFISHMELFSQPLEIVHLNEIINRHCLNEQTTHEVIFERGEVPAHDRD